MPQDQFQMAGLMNTDDAIEKIGKGYHLTARNVIFRGSLPRRRLESVPGTRLLNNPYLPLTGVNNCIGKFYDAVKKRVIFFNYNSLAQHGIYIYNTIAATFQRLIQSGVNTNGDILAFDANVVITSVDILYKDSSDGDVLYFIDSIGRPTQINIDQYLNGKYATINRNFIDVAKVPPSMPPYCVYENASNISNNNLRNALFQFRIIHVYDNYERSVYGTISKVPLPYTPDDPNINKDPTQNSRIAVYVPTGDLDVRRVEIWGKQRSLATSTSNNTLGDWFKITVLDKASLSIPSNSIYKYLFYNDAQYTYGNAADQVLLFSNVPQKANCGTVLGNVVVYAGITEGYNQVASDPVSGSQAPNMSILVNPISNDKAFKNGLLFFAAQGGTNSNGTGSQITLYLTGTGSNDISDNPKTLYNLSYTYLQVSALNGLGNNISFNVTASSNDVPSVLAQLQTAAVAAGWSLVSNTPNSLTLQYGSSLPVLLSSYFEPRFGATANQYFNFYTSLPNCNYAYGLAYYDNKGRTNGVIYQNGFSIKTPAQTYGANINSLSQVQISIYHLPPTWATEYQVLRTAQLTYSKLINWISKSASQGIINSSTYAWVQIDNMNDYNALIQASTGAVGYSFSPGDRIRFNARWYASGSAAVDLTYKSFDYEVLSLDVNPTINGTVKTGTFVKFLYPSGDIDGNFAFNGQQDFQYYQILLYNYNPRVNTSDNAWYEFGERFAIGSAGTSTAYHIGNIQSQNILTNPAVVTINEGDGIFRYRNIPIGDSYQLSAGYQYFSNQYVNALILNNPPLPVNTGQYILSPTPTNAFGGYILSGASLAANAFPQYGDAGALVQNTSGASLTVRFRATIKITADHATTLQIYAKVMTQGTATITPILQNSTTVSTTTTPVYVNIDASILVPPGGKLFYLYGNSTQIQNLQVYDYTLQLDVYKTIQIPIIELGYSDKYNIVASSNGRPLVIDPDARQQKFITRIRWSQPFQQGTTINGTNLFYSADYDEYERSFGQVQRIMANGRWLQIFQEHKIGRIIIYSKFIKDTTGSNTLITSDTIIQKNAIQYYDGDFGVANQPDCIVSSGFSRYFVDPIDSVLCRLSQDGIDVISTLYKVQTWAGTNLVNYLRNYNYSFGGSARIHGVYNVPKDRPGEWLCTLQGGTSAALGTLPGQTIGFEEHVNGFTSFYDFVPDNMICGENLLYSWYNGQMYAHDSAVTNNFYGIVYPATITVPFNDNFILKKDYRGITEVASNIWPAPLIYTNVMSYGTQRQESNLVATDFETLQSNFHAPFLRDTWSNGGIAAGDALQGNLIVVQFTIQNPTSLVTLSEASVYYTESALTMR